MTTDEALAAVTTRGLLVRLEQCAQHDWYAAIARTTRDTLAGGGGRTPAEAITMALYHLDRSDT